MEQYVSVLSNFGFPVTIACYLLFRLEKKLDALEVINRDLTNKISSQTAIIERQSILIEKLQDEIANSKP